jgi:hypothetical protein
LQDGLSVVGGNNNANIHGSARAALLLDTLPRKQRDRNYIFMVFLARSWFQRKSNENAWRVVGHWIGNGGCCGRIEQNFSARNHHRTIYRQIYQLYLSLPIAIELLIDMNFSKTLKSQ